MPLTDLNATKQSESPTLNHPKPQVIESLKDLNEWLSKL